MENDNDLTRIPIDPDEHVLVESEGDWASDLSAHLANALRSLTEYLGVEFTDGRLDEIAFEASDSAAKQMLREFREGKTRDVLSVADRPDFCFWTPHRAIDEDEGEGE
jgi:hypothetical protein